MSLTVFIDSRFSRSDIKMYEILDVRKIKGQSRYIRLGDVALLKLPPAIYRLCRVEQLLRDTQHGFVGTAAVKVFKRDSPGDPAWATGLMEIPIDRLKVIKPAKAPRASSAPEPSHLEVCLDESDLELLCALPTVYEKVSGPSVEIQDSQTSSNLDSEGCITEADLEFLCTIGAIQDDEPGDRLQDPVS
ncbi:MAG: hypothetical protein GY737_15165 [Desulfobacteraceae bacterium]|nr:hypothetical protein [Desulfobacteraceae bacterium]